MIYELYAVKDLLIGNFGAPFIAPNREVAIRSFDLQCKESPIANDLQLFKVGTFNLTTGQVIENFDFVKGCEHEG